MKYIALILIALIAFLNYQLWMNDTVGVKRVEELNHQLVEAQKEYSQLKERNKTLEADISSLQKDLAALEELARTNMGMIKKDETFYHILEPANNPNTTKK